MVVLKGFVPDCNVKEVDPKIDVFLSADGGREPTNIALAIQIHFKEVGETWRSNTLHKMRTFAEKSRPEHA